MSKPESSKGDHDDPLAGPTYIVGTVGVVVFVSIVILLQAVVYDFRDGAKAEQDQGSLRELSDVRFEQRRQLEGYGWTYPEENRVRIPVEMGVERVLEMYGHR